VSASDEKRIADARKAGEEARRQGKPRGANPYRGSTKLVRDLKFAWDSGWQAGATPR